jgi:hypothetical protein
MQEMKNLEAPKYATLKDSVACGTVLATMLLTMACGAFVVDAGSDDAPGHAAAASATEAQHE